jgi:response regulator of citrate/malate metabolism
MEEELKEFAEIFYYEHIHGRTNDNILKFLTCQKTKFTTLQEILREKKSISRTAIQKSLDYLERYHIIELDYTYNKRGRNKTIRLTKLGLIFQELAND